MLQLGTFLFEDFEIPERINFGGEHRLVTHRLMGGQRIIDAMGQDDADISWEGRFRGFDAAFRARQIDGLRQQGKKVSLVWHTFAYDVVVALFSADFERVNEVPYRITCRVVQDQAAAMGGLLSKGIDALLGDDLGALGSAIKAYSAPLASGALTMATAAVAGGPGALKLAGQSMLTSLAGRAVTDLGAAAVKDLGLTGSYATMANVVTSGAYAMLATKATGGSVKTVGSDGLAALGGVLAGAAGALTGRVAETGVAVSGKSIGGVAPGGDPAAMAQAVTTQAQTLEESYASVRGAAGLSRMAANVGAAP